MIKGKLRVNVDKIGLYEDDKYFRAYVKVDTHTLHSEKLNWETVQKLLADLLLGEKQK